MFNEFKWVKCKLVAVRRVRTKLHSNTANYVRMAIPF